MTRKETQFLLLCIALGTAACGKKGPPLAPFPRVPAQVGTVAALRMGDEAYLSFTVPVANVDGQQPADLQALEVYAVTSIRPPETEDERKVATLIATLPVRPILPELPAAPDGQPVTAPPIPPGVDRGATAVVRESLTPATRVPVELPAKEGIEVVEPTPADTDDTARPLVAPAPIELPRRHYFVIAMSPRGRAAVPSATVSVPLEAGSAAPGAPDLTYTESQITITWPPSPDARTATFVAPPPVVPPIAAADAPAAALTPAAPPPPPLTAKSLGFDSQATTYHVYAMPEMPESSDLVSLTLPAPLTPQPLAVTTFPVAGMTFGTERCYFVRPVDRVFGVVVQGPKSPIACVTPRDTFPPAAPRSLAAIGSAGVINLIWEPNIEVDLAGYLVLRGEAPGDKLQALTTVPVAATNYRDVDVRPGVRYVYVVVAVDRADPQNVSPESNRAEETARQ